MFRMATLTAAAVVSLSAGAAAAETFRWAAQTDPSTLDPHAASVAPVLGFLNNVYEGLVRRGPDMSIEPSLATAWEPIGTQGWRFHLREGVRFQGGESFDADDVLFSYQRATSEQSDVTSWFAQVTAVEVVDAHTVDFYTSVPNPLFPGSIANFMIMDRGWTEAVGAATPARDEEKATTLRANGTGPFQVVERAPDVRTVLAPFDGWWGEATHGITRAEFTPVSAAATRVAALLSGELDFMEPVPLQDVPRLEAADGVDVVRGVEARVLFFGFEHRAAELRYGDDRSAGANPFQDVRVRQAVYQAINADAIVSQIMRGNARTVGLLVGPGMGGYTPEQDRRLPYDPERARALLAEAGYPDGFRFGLRCPNDRYINDEAICTAAAAMLAAIGLDVELITVPVSLYFNELREGLFDMYLLGWSPGTFDAEHPIRFLMHTNDPEARLGSWNFGRYSNPEVDSRLGPIQTEIDPAARQALVDAVHTVLREDVVYVPTHVQPLVWGVRDGVTVVQRADNFFILRWVSVDG